MTPYFVVIDTNVLVSALLSKHSDAATVKVLEAFFSSKLTPLYNDEIINEYDEVLHRGKFHFSENVIQTLIKSICDNGISVEKIKTGEHFIDSKDIVFYEVCLAKREEDSLLVTGNIKHFPNKSFVVTPNELLKLIGI